MKAFNRNAAKNIYKKVCYKKGIVTVEFLDNDANVIKVTGAEMPHPDFRAAMNRLKNDGFLKIILGVDDTCILTPQAIERPDNNSVVLRGTIDTNYGEIEFKTSPIKMSDHLNDALWEMFNVVEEITNEAELYIFQGKTAQTSIPFEVKHDGLDGARAILSMTGTN
jgi:hypothetical protein